MNEEVVSSGRYLLVHVFALYRHNSHVLKHKNQYHKMTYEWEEDTWEKQEVSILNLPVV